jgi:DNA helicase HerA-like ATPase
MDFAARREVSLVCGRSGSGKSTFVLRYLLNAPGVACRFVFDPEEEVAARLRVTPARKPEELEAAVPSGWVVFDPSTMFPGAPDRAFRFFCAWAFEVSSRGPGRKVLVVDEAWRYSDPSSIPEELALAVNTGRKRGLSVMLSTQRPHRLHGDLVAEVTELVGFQVTDPLALQALRRLGVNPEELQSLPLGRWIAWNLAAPGRLAGRLF